MDLPPDLLRSVSLKTPGAAFLPAPTLSNSAPRQNPSVSRGMTPAAPQSQAVTWTPGTGSLEQTRYCPYSSRPKSTNLSQAAPRTRTTSNTRVTTTSSRSRAGFSRAATLSRAASRVSALSRAISSTGGSDDFDVICALTEARGARPSVGVALVNITTGEAILSQILDSQFYVKTIHKLQIYFPTKIVMISTACPPNKASNLYRLVTEEMPEIPIVAQDRRFWSEHQGQEYIRHLAPKADLDALEVAMSGNFYSTSAFCAVCLQFSRL